MENTDGFPDLNSEPKLKQRLMLTKIHLCALDVRTARNSQENIKYTGIIHLKGKNSGYKFDISLKPLPEPVSEEPSRKKIQISNIIIQPQFGLIL